MEGLSVVSVIIAAAAFVMAVIGPLITAFAKNRHERKMYELKFRIEHKHNVIENYVQCAGRCLFFCSLEDLENTYSNFAARCAEIYMYLPTELWADAQSLNEAIMHLHDRYSDNSATENAREKYFSFCQKISKLGRK